MTVGAALLVYAATLAGLGPVACRHNGWLTRAPRLGVGLLLATAWSVLTAVFLAGLTLALPGTALSSGLSHLLGACILRLRAAYVTPGGAAAAGAGLTLSAAIALRGAWALIQVARIRVAERRRQRLLIALCGRRLSEQAVVLDQQQPAAYCVAGRTSTVILTSGTLDLLTPSQLGAVLAHERAHLRARHHRLQAYASFAGRALPELRFMRDLPQHVGQLLELHADEMAARTEDPETLATALVAVATARPAQPLATSPLAVLAAADRDIALRIRRLLLPPAQLSRRRRRAIRAGAAAFGIFPLLVALTPAAVAANQPPVRQVGSVSTAHVSAIHLAPTGSANHQAAVRHEATAVSISLP